MRTRIIGIGSPFGLDRLGWVAADVLAAAGLERLWPELEIRKLDRPGGLLLAELNGVERAILIDAADAAEPAGKVLQFDVAHLVSTAAALSSHHLGVAEALALGRVLGRLPRRLVVIGISPGCGPWLEPVRLSAMSCQRLMAVVQDALEEVGPSRSPH